MQRAGEIPAEGVPTPDDYFLNNDFEYAIPDEIFRLAKWLSIIWTVCPPGRHCFARLAIHS